MDEQDGGRFIDVVVVRLVWYGCRTWSGGLVFHDCEKEGRMKDV